MLELENNLTLDRKAIVAPNLTDRFDEVDLQAIGEWVVDGYNSDKLSRAKWEKRNEAALDLATQLAKEKNFPWANCSNISFPLVTIGAMQFHARAYPTIIQGTDVVKVRLSGPDPSGKAAPRAAMVGRHMSYQVLEQDQSWEEQHDRMLLALAVSGCQFIKTYYHPELQHNVSELVMPQDLIMNYWSKSTEECYRKTHRVPLTRNDIRKGVLTGIYRDVLEENWYQDTPQPRTNQQDARADNRIGQVPPARLDETTPFFGLEQHCWLDLDGDGYAEPYIIIVEETSKAVLRIVCRFAREEDITRVQGGDRKGEIISIRAEEYFTKYSFIPSPDGGIYDMGFGVLLGPLNESANSIINQLVDSGTMSVTAGGFLTRGAKIRGGVYTFVPFGWQRVDATGDDLRKSIFPLPVREPSAVLFQLLGLLINYTNRISGATDTIVGENPGQNTPAQTTQTMVEMGMKIYNAIFKRVWRCMKEEFRKLYILNGTYMEGSWGTEPMVITRADYKDDPNNVVPYADPNITSEAQGMQQAMTIKQAAMATPGYNMDLVERNFLRALKIDNIEQIYPGVGKPGANPPPQDPKLAIAGMKQEIDRAKLELAKSQWQTQLKIDLEKATAEIRKLEAQTEELRAKATLEMEQAGGVQTAHDLQAWDAIIGLLKTHKDNLAEQLRMSLEDKNAQLDRNHERTMAAMDAGSSDESAA